MQMENQFQHGTIGYEGQEIHCLRAGNGPRVLLAFHGFHNDASIFLPLMQHLKEKFTLVSIDLPGHGATKWSLPFFEKKDLMALVQGCRQDQHVEKISLIGYSLGGRVCLNIIEQQPDWIEEVFLLAPDGLEYNVWYALATQNFWGKQVFRYMCRKPEAVLRKFEWLRKLRLVDESRYKFAKTKLADDRVRNALAYVWPVMSHLIPDRIKVKNYLNKYEIALHLFSGKYDRIFPPDRSKRFITGIKNAGMHLIDTGHNFAGRETMLTVGKIIQENSPL